MTYLFVYPLVGGAAPALILWALERRGVEVPLGRAGFTLYNAGIATLTVASFLQGVFEIAGTASAFTPLIRLMGAGLTTAAVLVGASRQHGAGVTPRIDADVHLCMTPRPRMSRLLCSRTFAVWLLFSPSDAYRLTVRTVDRGCSFA